MSKRKSLAIAGYVKPGFEAVRAAFVENFTRRRELGAACCIYYRGEKVVDLWGGIRNKVTGDPWEEETMVLVYSATKGLAGLTMALAQSQGLFDYDERVCTYWPEFAQAGKERITVRQLLSHQAGLFAFAAPVDKSVVADLDRLSTVLAQQKPAWEPGMRQGYHTISLGFYESELLRRVDPRQRSLGQFFQEEIASPLGLDFYIRLPEEIPNARLATIQAPNPALAMFSVPLPYTLAWLDRHSPLHRSWCGLGPSVYLDAERVYARNFEVPSGGGVGTARAMAQAYSEFANGGHLLGLREETLRQLMAPAVPPLHGFYDEVMKVEVPFSLGFMKPSQKYPFGHPSALVQRFNVVDNSEHLSQSLDSMVESPYPCCSWKLSQLPMSTSEDDDGASCVRIAARGLSPALSGATVASRLVVSSAFLKRRDQAPHGATSSPAPFPGRLPRLSPLQRQLVRWRVSDCTCASLERGQKSAGSAQTGRH